MPLHGKFGWLLFHLIFGHFTSDFFIPTTSTNAEWTPFPQIKQANLQAYPFPVPFPGFQMSLQRDSIPNHPVNSQFLCWAQIIKTFFNLPVYHSRWPRSHFSGPASGRSLLQQGLLCSTCYLRTRDPGWTSAVLHTSVPACTSCRCNIRVLQRRRCISTQVFTSHSVFQDSPGHDPSTLGKLIP